MPLADLPPDVADGDIIEPVWGNKVAGRVRQLGSWMTRKGQLLWSPSGTSVAALNPPASLAYLQNDDTGELEWVPYTGIEQYAQPGLADRVPIARQQPLVIYRAGTEPGTVGPQGQYLLLNSPPSVQGTINPTGVYAGRAGLELRADGMWVKGDSQSSPVYPLDASDGTLDTTRTQVTLSSITGFASTYGIASNGTNWYQLAANNLGSMRLRRYSATGGTLTTITPTGTESSNLNGSDIAYYNNRIYVLFDDNRTVRVYNDATLNEITSESFGLAVAGVHPDPCGIAVDADRVIIGSGSLQRALVYAHDGTLAAESQWVDLPGDDNQTEIYNLAYDDTNDLLYAQWAEGSGTAISNVGAQEGSYADGLHLLQAGSTDWVFLGTLGGNTSTGAGVTIPQVDARIKEFAREAGGRDIAIGDLDTALQALVNSTGRTDDEVRNLARALIAEPARIGNSDRWQVAKLDESLPTGLSLVGTTLRLARNGDPSTDVPLAGILGGGGGGGGTTFDYDFIQNQPLHGPADDDQFILARPGDSSLIASSVSGLEGRLRAIRDIRTQTPTGSRPAASQALYDVGAQWFDGQHRYWVRRERGAPTNPVWTWHTLEASDLANYRGVVEDFQSFIGRVPPGFYYDWGDRVWYQSRGPNGELVPVQIADPANFSRQYTTQEDAERAGLSTVGTFFFDQHRREVVILRAYTGTVENYRYVWAPAAYDGPQLPPAYGHALDVLYVDEDGNGSHWGPLPPPAYDVVSEIPATVTADSARLVYLSSDYAAGAKEDATFTVGHSGLAAGYRKPENGISGWGHINKESPLFQITGVVLTEDDQGDPETYVLDTIVSFDKHFMDSIDAVQLSGTTFLLGDVYAVGGAWGKQMVNYQAAWSTATHATHMLNFRRTSGTWYWTDGMGDQFAEGFYERLQKGDDSYFYGQLIAARLLVRAGVGPPTDHPDILGQLELNDDGDLYPSAGSFQYASTPSTGTSTLLDAGQRTVSGTARDYYDRYGNSGHPRGGFTWLWYSPTNLFYQADTDGTAFGLGGDRLWHETMTYAWEAAVADGASTANVNKLNRLRQHSEWIGHFSSETDAYNQLAKIISQAEYDAGGTDYYWGWENPQVNDPPTAAGIYKIATWTRGATIRSDNFRWRGKLMNIDEYATRLLPSAATTDVGKVAKVQTDGSWALGDDETSGGGGGGGITIGSETTVAVAANTDVDTGIDAVDGSMYEVAFSLGGSNGGDWEILQVSGNFLRVNRTMTGSNGRRRARILYPDAAASDLVRRLEVFCKDQAASIFVRSPLATSVKVRVIT